jgi:hypothetical protein
MEKKAISIIGISPIKNFQKKIKRIKIIKMKIL